MNNKRKIRQQLLIWMLLSISPLLLLGGYHLITFNHFFEQQAFDNLNQNADKKIQQIEEYLNDRLKDTATLARMSVTRRTFNILLPKFADFRRNQEGYIALMQELGNDFHSFLEHGFYDFFLISPAGDIILTLKHEADLYSNLFTGPYADSPLAVMFKKALTMQEASLSEFAYYPPSLESAAFMALPVLQDNKLLGVVAFQVDSKKLFAVIDDAVGLGVSGATQLFRAPSGSTFFADEPADAELKPIIQQAVLGENGQTLLTLPGQGDWLFVTRYIPALHAGMVVQFSADEAFQVVHTFWLGSIFISLILFCLVIWTIFRLSDFITRPIMRLSRFAQLITQGHQLEPLTIEGPQETRQMGMAFNHMLEQLNQHQATLEQRIQLRTTELREKEQYLSLTLDSIGDGVIITDSSACIERINPIAQQLTGWTGNEARQQNITQVFNMSNNDQPQTTSDLVRTVIEKGRIIHLGNNTVLTSREGQEYNIADAASPIRNKQGDILGMVLVFKDVTEKYQARQRERELAARIRLSEQHLRLFHEQSPIASIEWNRNCEVVSWNKQAQKIFGYTLAEVQKHNFIDLAVPDDITADITHLWKTLVAGEGGEVSINQNITKDGRIITCEWHNAPLRNHSGEIIGAISLVRDVTEQQRIDEVLRTLAARSEGTDNTIFKLITQKLALIYEARQCLLITVSPDNQRQLTTLAVWSDGDFIDNFSYLARADNSCPLIENIECHCHNEPSYSLLPDDDFLRSLQVNYCHCQDLYAMDGKMIGALLLLNNKAMNVDNDRQQLMDTLINRAASELERYQAEKQLQLASRIFTESHEGISIVNKQGLIIDVNPAFCKMTGYCRQELLGKNPRILKSGLQSAEFYKDMWGALEQNGFWQGEFWNRKKNGELYAEHKTITRLMDDDGLGVIYVGLGSDITKHKQQESVLEQMAYYDVLTKLPNRVLFADRIVQAMAHSKRDKSLLAVCFLDLDHFKPVNDTYGHQIGDQVLIEVARRITSAIREEDTASRLSGDEFALLLGDLESIDQCHNIMRRLHDLLAETYHIDDLTITLSASSGVTLYPQDSSDPDTLLRHADSAMYQSKLKGRNCYYFYDADRDQQIRLHHERLNKIAEAFQDKQFCLYYQPKINMQSGQVFGVEALIRWIHPQQGVISPLEFLPYLDGTELEIELGNWVIEQAWRQLVQWQEHGLFLEVSVNISSRHLQWPGFCIHVDNVLAAQPQTQSQYLQLEILESSALGDVQLIREVIKKCRDDLGVSVALDDFGTGYSSLTHLRRLPVNVIKIDQSFVRDMLDDENDYAIIEGVVGLAKVFKRDVVAEGVETIEHGLKLMQMGCMNAQGYVIARPMPEDEFLSWIKNYQPASEWRAYARKIQ